MWFSIVGVFIKFLALWGMRAMVSLLVGLLSFSSFASVREVRWGINDMYSAPRWEYGQGEVSPSALSFKNVKVHLSRREFQKCIHQAELALVEVPVLTPWVNIYRLRCAEGFAQARGDYDPLGSVLSEVSPNLSWLLTGPYRDSFRQAFLSGLLVHLAGEVRSGRSGKTRAWQTVDQLRSYFHWLSKEQRTQLWRQAGELALAEKKWSLAEDFLERSLSQRESVAVRKKLLWAQSQLPKESRQKGNRQTETTQAGRQRENQKHRPSSALSVMTEGEKRLLNRMRKSKAPLSVVKVGVELMAKFPGGEAAIEAADRMGDVFLRLGKKRSRSGEYERVLNLMLKSDGQRLYGWAQRAYKAELYESAYRLARQSYKEVKGLSEAPQVLRLLGLSAFHGDRKQEAAKYWGILGEKYSASEFSEEAVMRLGMLRYREKKDQAAVSHFERAIAISRETKYEIISRYWLWRCMERLKSKRAHELGAELMSRFPLTYYGLRARMELAEGQRVRWPLPSKKSLTARVWLTETEYRGWERFQLLLKAGWFKEAQQELLEFPEPKSDGESLLLAKWFSLAFNHHRAIVMSTKVWERSPQLLNLETLRLAYPIEYWSFIEGESKKYNLDPFMVISLMKQESAFQRKAKSISQAMGLMQLIRPTARDVARQLRKKINVPSDLFHPATNIQLGTRYMRQMIRAFKGHIPLALAAYNTGIGHMRIWLRTREELKELQSRRDSHPDHEMWIDELPWAETSYYVKAILRNYILYKALDEKEMAFRSPLWSQNK